ncbi:hypothetical protein DFP72DRAFT_1064894 [Ephemerocybe angulata]|uniref:Uncharacterized protein n=1 Tax=Ephemerocybe angulata TaxID=980116 RepID=A0A8H6I3X4_9AGAR|nr:hypothetical protein DFP72DRAFT_1064894 [Tulosesus angulatus]
MDADMFHQPKFIPQDIQFIAKSHYLDIVAGTLYRPTSPPYLEYAAPTTPEPGRRRLDQQLPAASTPCPPTFRQQGGLEGYVLQMETMVHAHALGYSDEEVPITFIAGIFGEQAGASELVQLHRSFLQALSALGLDTSVAPAQDTGTTTIISSNSRCRLHHYEPDDYCAYHHPAPSTYPCPSNGSSVVSLLKRFSTTCSNDDELPSQHTERAFMDVDAASDDDLEAKVAKR